MSYLVLVVTLAVAAFLVARHLRASPMDLRPRAGAPDLVREPAPPVDVEALLRKLAPHRRTAFIPVVEEGDASRATSRFAGVPMLRPGETWPACGNCGRPMQLFVQLAGSDLPEVARSRIAEGELLQLFYCTSSDPPCEYDCDAFSPHAKSTLLRIIEAAGSTPAPGEPAGMFPAKRIVGWTARDDYPGYEELEELGEPLGDPELDALSEEHPLEGEKLLGWPLWVQSMEYPGCRRCGARMALLFQIDSERNLPHMFGDVGIGHVTQCPEHRDELAFGWACH